MHNQIGKDDPTKKVKGPNKQDLEQVEACSGDARITTKLSLLSQDGINTVAAQAIAANPGARFTEMQNC